MRPPHLRAYTNSQIFINSFLIALLSVFIVASALLAVGFALDAPQSQPSIVSDCAPDLDDPTLEDCQSRRCQWHADAKERQPKCRLPNDNPGYYIVKRISAIEGVLQYDGLPYYGQPITKLQYKIYPVTQNHFRLTITNPEEDRFRVPHFLVPVDVQNGQEQLETSCCKIEICKHPFGVRIWRKATNITIFDSCHTADFYFADQFLQISTRLASANLYGFGEHTAHRLRRSVDWRRWPMWSRDEGVYNNTHNLYGVQPFYLNIEDERGNSNGVLLLNSNAMEVWLQPAPAVTWRALGGIVDLHIFSGPTPANVVEQLTALVGRPSMPPYWSLGFHLSRWGYESTNQIRLLHQRMAEYQIPLDAQWADIDYTKSNYPLTYDECSSHWNDLPTLVAELKAANVRFVPIIDPCIRNVSSFENQLADAGFCQDVEYSPYTDGMEQSVFVKRGSNSSEPFLGVLWPGQCYYPDFTNPKMVGYWYSQIEAFKRKVDFDGLWIDMNEVSNFNDANGYNNTYARQCANDSWNYPQFIPRVVDHRVAGLMGKTMCMEAELHAGRHYDVHSLYGHSMSKVTNEALRQLNPQARPFVLTRSNFVGTGRYAFHWLGDNQATWDQMQWSIVGVLEYNLFGISMVGADICGFVLNTTEALCRRWTQLGAFYPFSRNHNIRDAVAQDPTAFGDAFAYMARRVIVERYRLLPYLYTLFYQSHAYGTPVARPLFLEFPGDNATWDLEDQFMWGSALMISPVLSEMAVSRSIYFPKSRWYDYFNRTEIALTTGTRLQMECDQDCVPLHLRGGSVVALQRPALNTARSRENPMVLLVALDENGQASGSLFLDDGESEVDLTLAYHYVTFEVKTSTRGECTTSLLSATFARQAYRGACILDEVVVMGLGDRPNWVTYANEAANSLFDQSKRLMVVSGINADCQQWQTSDLKWETCSRSS